MYVCDENQLCQFFSKSAPTFFLLCMMIGASISIEWWRYHVDLYIEYHFFGRVWSQFCPKTNTLLIFSKTAPRGFFKPRIRIGDINTYQIAKIASKLIHFFRRYSRKLGSRCYTSMKQLVYQIDAQGGQASAGALWQRISTLRNDIGLWAQLRSGRRPKWDWDLGPNKIRLSTQLRFSSGPIWYQANYL